MPRVRNRNAYQHSSDFDKGRIVAIQNCSLSHRSIAIRVCRDPMTICRKLNRSVQDGNMERHAGSHAPLLPAEEKTSMLPAWS
ncbi:hypothetical protein TNCV_821411 [Trichonephila clavipes]|nr:hypothetical protein TNCV_821411 [Trichonephila clavipes]